MMKGSIRNKLILTIFIGCLIPYLVGGLYLKSFIEKWMYNNTIHNSKQMLHQVSEQIDSTLMNDMKEEVNLLASLDCVKNAGANLNDYTSYDKNTFKYKENSSEQSIEGYFKALKETHKMTNFIFFGTEDGGYMEYPRFTPSQSYDPRQRPWYIQAMKQDKIIMSEPYITSSTNEMVISFAKPVKQNNKTIGVVGISVKLDELTTKLSNIKIGNNGFILVMSPQMKFVVSPNNSNWTLKTPQELELKSFDSADIKENNSFTANINGNGYVLNSVTLEECGMHILAATDKNEILQEVENITSILLIIYIATYVIIFIIIYQISRRITKPILEIASVINHMTDFNFSFDDNRDMYSYAQKTDEIGIVAKALVDMHHNYYELMKQVSLIDEEIKNIDISDNKKIKLELSEKNPFNGVICSMNVLLEKVELYFEKLKAKNNEIIENNKLLTISEDKLRTQLLEINQQKERINYMAYHDALTGLPNRRKFVEQLTKELELQAKGAVVLLDIDDFKGINDTLGHMFGDRVICAVSKRLQALSGANMFVSRFGGDEFLILLLYNNDSSELDDYIKKIKAAFEDKVYIEDNEIEIRISMGITLFPQNSTDENRLVMEADLAMYAVKSSGKNNFKYFDRGMMDNQIKISNIEIILREAIEQDGFKMVYQPQVDLKSGATFGYEALLRLKEHKLSPAEFIEVAEKNGSIIKVGRIVTEKVIRQLSEWKKLGMKIKPVAINFSANQLHDHSYILFLQQLLEQYEIEPEFLEIEITENIFFENKQVTLEFLKQLKEMGIRIAIDDFGTGYSSLNYLTFLPVDIIKLDRSLNLRFLEIENVKVMNSLISLVHSLNLEVVAEGIETKEQVKRLEEAKCDYIQGYYFSKPVDAEEIPKINLKIYDTY